MFLSKINLIALKSKSGELNNLINKENTKQNLYEFIKDDLIFFLQKVLAGKIQHPQSEEIGAQHREITQILKELGVYSYYPIGRDFNKTSIVERWFGALASIGDLTFPKLINYFNIYRNRMYSLTDKCPYEFLDLHILIHKMLNSGSFKISFEEIYNAELLLRQEISFSLLRQISPNNRLEYLIGKEILNELSDEFIKILHKEFSAKLMNSIEEQKTAVETISREKATIDSELKIATKQHLKTLQKDIPIDTDKIRFRLYYEPLMRVGGDYYNIKKHNDLEYSIFLADISGHGISAAMFINTIKLSYESCLSHYDRPEKMLRKLNETLYGKLSENFVTAIYIYINLKKNQIRYCNAGHPKGFLYPLTTERKGVRFLRQTGKVLGIFQKNKYRDPVLSIQGNERLVIYTDGISEIHNQDNAMLNERGLLRALTGTYSLDIDTALNFTLDRIKEFQKDAKDIDDKCLLFIDFLK